MTIYMLVKSCRIEMESPVKAMWDGLVPVLEWKAGTKAEQRFEVYSQKVFLEIVLSALLYQPFKNNNAGLLKPVTLY